MLNNATESALAFYRFKEMDVEEVCLDFMILEEDISEYDEEIDID